MKHLSLKVSPPNPCWMPYGCSGGKSFKWSVWFPPPPPQEPGPVECGGEGLAAHLGLIRLATTMMSLTLAEVFILAPEPIVMATSFSVRV